MKKKISTILFLFYVSYPILSQQEVAMSIPYSKSSYRQEQLLIKVVEFTIFIMKEKERQR
jgi:hypothetical protein